MLCNYSSGEHENVTQEAGGHTNAPGIHYFHFTAYIVIGILLICANIPIFVNILRHAVLRARKEYLLLAGLAFADTMAGLSTLIAGAYRLKLIALEEENKEVSRLHCAGTPPFVLLIFSMIAQAGMLVVISVDRLFAVTLPLRYFAFTKVYAIIMITICYLPTTLYTIILILYAFIYRDSSVASNALCIIGGSELLFNSVFYIRLCMATLSVMVYAVVWFLFRRYQKVTVASFPNAKHHLCKAQRHLTATVGICAIFTLIFYVVPTSLMFTELEADMWAPLYWAISCFNAVVDVFVYSLRHEDIRTGLKLLFTGKEMPSQAALVRRRESTITLSVTAQSAALILRYVGIVVSSPIFRRVAKKSSSAINLA